MKLASFLYQGKRSYGIVQADGVIDAAGEDDMIDWLAQFAPNDISAALADVMALYNRQSVTTSTSKKKAGGQTER